MMVVAAGSLFQRVLQQLWCGFRGERKDEGREMYWKALGPRLERSPRRTERKGLRFSRVSAISKARAAIPGGGRPPGLALDPEPESRDFWEGGVGEVQLRDPRRFGKGMKCATEHLLMLPWARSDSSRGFLLPPPPTPPRCPAFILHAGGAGSPSSVSAGDGSPGLGV